MKRFQVLALCIVALFLFSAVPFQQAAASTPYSEKLNVYVSGSSALWYMTFTGVNASGKLSGLESATGLSWYNITAVKTTGWVSDFQAFGPQGYNLIPAPFLPSEGLFLTVGSDSFADATAAANALNSYTLSTFVPLSNASGVFTFYSPVSFNDIIPATLLASIPSTMGGFANAISPTEEASSLSPIVVYEGVRSTSGFDHTLVVGSISNKALDAENRPNVPSYFGSSITSLTASNRSTSSTVNVRILDGILASKVSGAVSNDVAHFTGTYTLALVHGQKFHLLNATVLQQPVSLLATRVVDSGVLQQGDNVSISISLTNLSNSTVVTRVSGSDAWWSPTEFKLVRHNASISFTSIAAGATQTPTYVLQYIGTSSGPLTIPPAVIDYSYAVGLTTFNATVSTNPVTVSLGASHAVVLATIAPVGGYGKVVGGSQKALITLKNVGSQTASGVSVAGQQISGIPSGSTSSVNVTLASSGFLGTNGTKTYAVQYTDLEGGSLAAETNVLPVLFSHSSMKVGLLQVVISAQIRPLKGGGTNLTIAYTTSNLGSAKLTSVVAREFLPAGLGCGKVNGSAARCSAGLVSLNYTSLLAGASKKVYEKFNITSPANYFFPPVTYGGLSVGFNLTGRSNPIAVPTGIVLSKAFTPSKLFGGMVSSVRISAVNSGPYPAYNASISSSVDSFDSLATSSVTSASGALVAPGANLSSSYSVTTSASESGNLTASQVVARVFFGGVSYNLAGPASTVTVYQPLSVSITTSPDSPTEGKSFTVQISITNPSGVAVNDVLFTLPVPSGLTLSQLAGAQVSGGVLTVSLPSEDPHVVYNASASAVASSGIVVPFDKAKITFSYGGVTINGRLPTQGIAIGENVTTRYLIPTAAVFVVLLATAFYLRRKAAPSVPASPK